MLVLGLTGSLGAGKTAVAQMLRQAGIPVQDADQVVRALYEDPFVVQELLELLPAFKTTEGGFSKEKLAPQASQNPEIMKALEAFFHPRVRQAHKAFLAHHKKAKAPLVVLEVPLLFETGLDALCDVTLVVVCPEEVRHLRAMERPHMSFEKFKALSGRQMPEAEKIKRADHVLRTDQKKEDTQRDLTHIVHMILKGGT